MGKYYIVDGAMCTCKFGVAPGMLKVDSQQKLIINVGKKTATTRELQNTFYPPAFGTCKYGWPPRPCAPMITQWLNPYQGMRLPGGAFPLMPDSKGVCAVSGTPCVEIVNHGQMEIPGVSHAKNATAEHLCDLDCGADSMYAEEEFPEIKIIWGEGTSESIVIAIDPGHGDHHDNNRQIDPGAVNGTIFEKDIVLKISNSINRVLKANGYTTVMTRTGNVENAGERFTWRTNIANENKADIFVSIHVNSHATAQANGFEVLYRVRHEDSRRLAKSIVRTNTLFRDRGVQTRENTGVLSSRRFSGAAVIVEAGFISNASDLQIMTTQYDKIGVEVATGIMNFLKNK